MYNATAFNTFYKLAWRFCKPRLRKLTTNDADIEDVFAEAIARFWVNSQQGNIAHDGNHEALVYVMARNLWLSQYRKTRQVHMASLDADDHDGEPIQIADNELDMLNAWVQEADNHQHEAALGQAWAKLDDKCQSLLTATIVYKERNEDLAERLALKNSDTVKASKYRCLQYLKKFYQQYKGR